MGTMHKLRPFAFFAAGIAISAGSLIMMNSFMRTLRPVLVMGSKYGSGGAVTQSIFTVLVLIFLFLSGITLIILSVRNMFRSFKK